MMSNKLKVLTNFRTPLSCCLFLGYLCGVFLLGLVAFCKNIGYCELLIGQNNLLGGQFWASGRFNLLGGQSRLLGGQMPTQFTCYLLPPWTIACIPY